MHSHAHLLDSASSIGNNRYIENKQRLKKMLNSIISSFGYDFSFVKSDLGVDFDLYYGNLTFTNSDVDNLINSWGNDSTLSNIDYSSLTLIFDDGLLFVEDFEGFGFSLSLDDLISIKNS